MTITRDAHLEDGDLLYTHPAPSVLDGWQPSDDELTNIYNTANGLDPKRHNPITTERIFTAMRAMLSAAPNAQTTDDRKDAEPWKERLRRIYDTLPDEAKKFYGKHGFAAYCAALDAEINAAMAAQKGEKG